MISNKGDNSVSVKKLVYEVSGLCASLQIFKYVLRSKCVPKSSYTNTSCIFHSHSCYKFFFFSYNTVVINHHTSLADDKISIGQNTFFFFFFNARFQFPGAIMELEM